MEKETTLTAPLTKVFIPLRRPQESTNIQQELLPGYVGSTKNVGYSFMMLGTGIDLLWCRCYRNGSDPVSHQLHNRCGKEESGD